MAQLNYMLSGIDWRNPVYTFRPALAGITLLRFYGSHFTRVKSVRDMIQYSVQAVSLPATGSITALPRNNYCSDCGRKHGAHANYTRTRMATSGLKKY